MYRGSGRKTHFPGLYIIITFAPLCKTNEEIQQSHICICRSCIARLFFYVLFARPGEIYNLAHAPCCFVCRAYVRFVVRADLSEVQQKRIEILAAMLGSWIRFRHELTRFFGFGERRDALYGCFCGGNHAYRNVY